MAMTYTIDIYQGKLKPTYNFVHFLAYLSMFPQILAGPIARARDLLPQLKNPATSTEQQRWEAFQLIIHGFFKKCVIADNLVWTINNAFGSAKPFESSIYWWIIAVLFSFQIYCDFSGYSDIARGLAKLMGFELPENFNHPYISSSFREFWTRWHISLSTWFRDYVYIPMGGSKKGVMLSHFNMWATMLISGLWHGAAWTYIIWAALHSFYISMERITNWHHNLVKLKGGRILATLIVFIFTTIAWLFFRAHSFNQAINILSIMFSFKNFNFNIIANFIGFQSLLFLLVMIFREIYFYLGLNNSVWTKSKLYIRFQPVILSVIIIICVLLRGPGDAFIYFQF